jgi:hypothetical protein
MDHATSDKSVLHEVKIAFAVSSGFPSDPINVWETYVFFLCSGTLAINSVPIIPGATAFTLTGFNSTAKPRMAPSTAPPAAATTLKPGGVY